MSAISARILGAVATVAFVITPVATAGNAGSATPLSPSPATAAGVAEPVSAVVPAYSQGIDAGVGTWEQFVDAGHPGRRSYFVYTPPGLDPGRAVPLVVVLHGCRQSADLALGSGVNALADRKGFVAVYPEQSVKDNPRRCWNWFDVRDQVRGFGEPAEIAAITEQVLSRPGGARLDHSRVYVMGMSAGGAMAGILAVTYPDLYAAVGMHSALEYAAAQNVIEAYVAMRFGGPEPHLQGLLAYAVMGPRARVVPAIVFQGGADETVWPVNGDRLVRQWLATSRLATGDLTGFSFAWPQASFDARAPGGLAYSVRTWNDFSGRPVVQYWTVPGLAHAWSGGAFTGSFTDPRGPSATEAMYDFFLQSTR
jgi:poly(hydroxyalkanoate) depolymerase family esterase